MSPTASGKKAKSKKKKTGRKKESGIVLVVNRFSQNVNEDGHTYAASFYFIEREKGGWRATASSEPELKKGNHYHFFIFDLTNDQEPKGRRALGLLVSFIEQDDSFVHAKLKVHPAYLPKGGSPFGAAETDELGDGITAVKKGKGKGKGKVATDIGVGPLVGIWTGRYRNFGYAHYGPIELKNTGHYFMNLWVGYKGKGVFKALFKVDPHMDIDN